MCSTISPASAHRAFPSPENTQVLHPSSAAVLASHGALVNKALSGRAFFSIERADEKISPHRSACPMPFPSVSIPLIPLIRTTARLTMDLTDYDAAEHSRLCHAVDVLLARVVALCVALVH